MDCYPRYPVSEQREVYMQKKRCVTLVTLFKNRDTKRCKGLLPSLPLLPCCRTGISREIKGMLPSLPCFRPEIHIDTRGYVTLVNLVPLFQKRDKERNKGLLPPLPLLPYFRTDIDIKTKACYPRHSFKLIDFQRYKGLLPLFPCYNLN